MHKSCPSPPMSARHREVVHSVQPQRAGVCADCFAACFPSWNMFPRQALWNSYAILHTSLNLWPRVSLYLESTPTLPRSSWQSLPSSARSINASSAVKPFSPLPLQYVNRIGRKVWQVQIQPFNKYQSVSISNQMKLCRKTILKIHQNPFPSAVAA